MRVLRPTLDRFDETLDVLRAADVAVYGDSDWTASDLRDEWDGLDLERDAWLVELDGRIAGVAHLLDRKGGRFIGDGYVHPALTGRGVGNRVLDLLETRVLELRPEWPENGRIVVEAAHLVGDARAPELFRGRGFERARSFFRMVADVSGEQPPPEWPDGIELRPLDVDLHGAALYDAELEAFANEWEYVPLAYDEWRDRVFGRSGFDPSLVPVAWDGEGSSPFRATTRSGTATGASSAPSACARAGAGAGSACRSSTSRSGASGKRERRPWRSASTSRTRRARRACTSAPGCGSSGRPTSGRRSSVPDVVLRAPTLADVGAVVAVINRASQRRRGQDEVDANAIEGWWTQPPPWNLGTDAVVAVRGGSVVGYGDLGDQAKDGSVLWLDVRGEASAEVHAELERRALGRRSPDGVVRAAADESDDVLRAIFEERGYELIRSSYRMGIEVDGATFSPLWPAGAVLRTAVEGVDEPLLHELNERSFADHWGHTPMPYEEWLHWLRSMGVGDPALWFSPRSTERRPASRSAGRSPRRPGLRVGHGARRRAAAPQGRPRHSAAAHALAALQRARAAPGRLGVDAESTTGAVGLYERAGMRVTLSAGTSGNAGRERAPRPLPVLPDADGCGVRRRLRVPQLRRLVRGRSGPCPAGLGEGRRGDGGSGAHGACLARGAGGRAGVARGAVERGRTRAAKSVRSCSADAAAPMWARSGGSPATTSVSL